MTLNVMHDEFFLCGRRCQIPPVRTKGGAAGAPGETVSPIGRENLRTMPMTAQDIVTSWLPIDRCSARPCCGTVRQAAGAAVAGLAVLGYGERHGKHAGLTGMCCAQSCSMLFAE